MRGNIGDDYDHNGSDLDIDSYNSNSACLPLPSWNTEWTYMYYNTLPLEVLEEQYDRPLKVHFVIHSLIALFFSKKVENFTSGEAFST